MDYKILSALNKELSELRKGFDDFLSFLSKRPEFKECGIEIKGDGFSFWGRNFEFSFIYNKENHSHFYLSEIFYEDNKKPSSVIKFRLDTPINAVRIINNDSGEVVYNLENIKNPAGKNADTFVNGFFRYLNTYLEGGGYQIV